MGMGFNSGPVEPKHLVALSEGDVCELREALRLTKDDPITDGGGVLREMLDALPDLFEGGTFHENLSERGKQALERMVAGVHLHGYMNVHRPGATTELIEELAAAQKEAEIANAHLTISLFEGHPGEERSAIVKRRTAAEDRLSDAAMRYGLAVMNKQEQPRREALTKPDLHSV